MLDYENSESASAEIQYPVADDKVIFPWYHPKALERKFSLGLEGYKFCVYLNFISRVRLE